MVEVPAFASVLDMIQAAIELHGTQATLRQVRGWRWAGVREERGKAGTAHARAAAGDEPPRFSFQARSPRVLFTHTHARRRHPYSFLTLTPPHTHRTQIYAACAANGRIAYKRTAGSRSITDNDHWKSQIRHALYTGDRFAR